MFSNEAELETALSDPPPRLVEMFRQLPGDLLLLGAGGKMGPTLARMARRAADEAGGERRVYAASRFTNSELADQLRSHDVQPVVADLSDPDAWRTLPDAPLVLFMVGCKFGTADRPGRTWVSNTLVPAYACQRFANSRIAAFSSGNVYPMVPPDSGGCREEAPVGPIGEYAMSVLGRERVFQHFAQENGTPIALIRLNYAVEMRYGVLMDIAQQILADRPVDRSTNWVNMIWQRDANAHALLALELCDSPAVPINVTGLTVESVTDLAQRLGERLQRPVTFTGEPQATALLNNASQAAQRFYPPAVDIETLIEWTAQWLRDGHPVWDRPTHFQVRSGKY